MIDRTSLNIVSIVVGAAGLLTVLTGFNVRQLRMSFFGENPYQLKRDIIQSTMDWIFGGLAVAGLLLQLGAEIAGDALEERLYSTASYVRVTLISAALTGILVWLLTRLGRAVARLRWRPLIVSRYGEMLQRARFVLSNDGFFPEHFAERDKFSDEQNSQTRDQNYKAVDDHLRLIEDLLEIKAAQGLEDRVSHLERAFDHAKPAA